MVNNLQDLFFQILMENSIDVPNPYAVYETLKKMFCFSLHSCFAYNDSSYHQSCQAPKTS